MGLLDSNKTRSFEKEILLSDQSLSAVDYINAAIDVKGYNTMIFYLTKTGTTAMSMGVWGNIGESNFSVLPVYNQTGVSRVQDTLGYDRITAGGVYIVDVSKVNHVRFYNYLANATDAITLKIALKQESTSILRNFIELSGKVDIMSAKVHPLYENGTFASLDLSTTGQLAQVNNTAGYDVLCLEMNLTVPDSSTSFGFNISIQDTVTAFQAQMFDSMGYVYSGILSLRDFNMLGSNVYRKIVYIPITAASYVRLRNETAASAGTLMHITYSLVRGTCLAFNLKAIQPLSHWQFATVAGTTSYGGTLCEINNINPLFKYIFLAVNYTDSVGAAKSTVMSVIRYWGVEDYRTTPSLGNLVLSKADILMSLSSAYNISDWDEVKGKYLRFYFNLDSAPISGDLINVVLYGVR